MQQHLQTNAEYINLESLVKCQLNVMVDGFSDESQLVFVINDTKTQFSQRTSSAHVQRETAPCLYVETVSIKLTRITGGKCFLQMPIRLRTSKSLVWAVMTYLLNYE